MGAVEKIKLGKKIEGSEYALLGGVETCSKGKERQESMTIRGKSVPSGRVASAKSLGWSVGV